MGYFQRITLAVISSILFMGCNTLELTVNFKEIDGLVAGSPVILDNTAIGRVKQILPPTNDNHPAVIEIDSDFKALITEHSTFTLASEYQGTGLKSESASKSTETNSKSTGTNLKFIPVIIVSKTASGGTPLQSGAVVQGEAPPMIPEFSNILKKFQTGFETFKNKIDKIPESQEFKSFEQSIDELAQRMKDSGKDVRDNIKNDILPKLQQEFEAFKQRFEEQNKNQGQDQPPRQDLAPLEKKLNNLQDI